MSPLIWNLLLCILYWILPLPKQIKVFMTFFQAVMLHTFVDMSTVPDLNVYNRAFDYIEENIEVSDEFGMEKAFQFMMLIVGFFIPDFRFFLFVVSFLYLYFNYKTFGKYSPYITFSVIILLLAHFNQSLFIIRQNLSISILSLSYPYIIEKKFKQFSLVVLIASAIHISSAIFFPVYFLYWITDRKKYIRFVAAISVFMFFMSQVLFNYMTSYIDTLAAYSANYSTGSGNSDFHYSAKGIIMIAILLLYIVFLKSHVFDFGINRLVLTCSILGIVGNLFYSNMGTGRMFLSYNAIIFIQIPIILMYIKNKFVKLGYAMSMISLYYLFAYHISSDSMWVYKINFF